MYYSIPEKNLEHNFSYIGHFLLFSSIAFVNNTIFYIETQIRFSIFISMIILGSILIYFYGYKKRQSYSFLHITLILLISLAIIRINIISSVINTSPQTQIIQATVTLISLACSLLISNKFNILLTRNIMMVSFTFVFIPIFIYRENLFDYSSKDNFRIGVLNYESYQMISQIIGFMIICTISFFFEQKKMMVKFLPLLVPIFLGFYTISLSPARGESIALILAVCAYFLSSGRSFLILAVMIGLVSFAPQILSAPLFADSVLFERLSDVLKGDFSDRDYLFSLALNQIINNLSLLAIGGGLNYYQVYNVLPLELYPHNFLLESIISGGITLFISFIMLFVIPIIKSVKNIKKGPESRFLITSMIFLFVIYMKSGTLNSMWGLCIFACLFVASTAAPINQD
jgi:hypothetical protein